MSAEGIENVRDLGYHYAERAKRQDPTWLEDAIEDYLGVTVTEAQRDICRLIVKNEKVLVQTANGIGKSFILACVTVVWLVAYHPASVLATSGTYPKLKRTFCKPVESLHSNALGGAGLPGTFKQSPPRIEIDGEPEQYFEAASPTDAGELEGVHSGYVLGIIEEADKDDVTEATFEAMESLVSDQRDRLVAIANPPDDETNSLQRLYEDPTWKVVRKSSFESHNVQHGLEGDDDDAIDGLATAWKIKQDWQSYVDEPWPGLDQAEAWTVDPEAPSFRSDLSSEWYKRRGGITPPGEAGVHRPLDPELVDAQYRAESSPSRDAPTALGVDVARSGDDTVAAGVRGDTLVIEYEEQGTDHTEQETQLAELIRSWPTPDIAVDAVGEGSGLADGLDSRFGAHRFKNQATAHRETQYDDCWAESLALLSDYLEGGGIIIDSDLHEQAKIAARTVTWRERHLASRGDDGADVLAAEGRKADVKDRLGRSPDHLDAALMAVWRDKTETQGGDPLAFQL